MAKAPHKITFPGLVVGWALVFALTAPIAFFAFHTLNHWAMGPSSRIGGSFPSPANNPRGNNG
jgi:hypothetical protein